MAFFFAFSALRPPRATAAPAPKSRTPPGAGTGVPPEVEVEVEVDVEVDDEVVLEPPVDVELLDDELFEDLLLFEHFDDLVDFVLLLDWQKIKHLLDFELLLNQLVALASLGVAATTPAVAIEAPMTAACVILIYCIVSSPSLCSADHTAPRLTKMIKQRTCHP